MAKKASDKPSASAEEALKRRKKQARQEAKLMMEIEEANKDLKKAQKKQSKAQARLRSKAHMYTPLKRGWRNCAPRSWSPQLRCLQTV